ncbi:MAG: hypothetical protein K9L28_04075 [Synergistales bacterium]|nr:hypothetical protein [Synergistales bacterium]
MREQSQLLGFFLEEDDKEVYHGAALVSDLRGIPRDFRYTDPIRPTKLERVLYGGALDVYLREEVILKNLVEAIELAPALWLCSSRELLGPLRGVTQQPVAMLQESTHKPLDNVGDRMEQPEDGLYLVQLTSMSAPYRLRLPKGDLGKVDTVVPLLEEAAETMDLLEPFARIRKAMDIVYEEQGSHE